MEVTWNNINWDEAIRLREMRTSTKTLIKAKTGIDRNLTSEELYSVAQDWAQVCGFPYEKFDPSDTSAERCRKKDILKKLVDNAEVVLHLGDLIKARIAARIKLAKMCGLDLTDDTIKLMLGGDIDGEGD